MSRYQNPSITSQGKNEDFTMQLARGHIANHNHVHKTGYIASGFNNGDTVWSEGVVYPWSAISSPSIISIAGAADNAEDRDLPIVLVGLDVNYKTISEEIRLNETNSSTAVNTTKQFLRINNAYVNNGTTNVKKILFSVSDTVIYTIEEGFGTSHVGVYTVPANKTAYLIKGVATGTTASTIGFYLRLVNEGFKVQHIAIVDNSTYIYDFTIPLPFPEKTDMDIRGIIGGGKAAINWDMILVDN